MTDGATGKQADPTAIEFAVWPTPVENDDLSLVTVNYTPELKVKFPGHGLSPALADSGANPRFELEAIFLSRQHGCAVRFGFDGVLAFRLLDEAGLTQLWAASRHHPRPARSTFRVRGHGWQAESPLLWIHGTTCKRYSYIVATDDDCLEIVCAPPPLVELLAMTTPPRVG